MIWSANALHFLFCSFSECNEFEDIFGALEFLQRYGVDENQADQGGQTPKKYAFKKFGKRNEMLWKVSAALSQTDSTAELCDRWETFQIYGANLLFLNSELERENFPRPRFQRKNSELVAAIQSPIFLERRNSACTRIIDAFRVKKIH